MFAAGFAESNVNVGFVASRLIVTDRVDAPPALVAEQVKVVPEVSLLICVVVLQLGDLDVMLD